MGGFGSKPTLPINALHFRVYSFQNQDTYQRCLDYANTMSALVEQAAVTKLTDDLTFIACYRVHPYKKKDMKLVQEEIKNFVGPQYSLDYGRSYNRWRSLRRIFEKLEKSRKRDRRKDTGLMS
ncbi:hypothetical protein V866_008532 [Kwoniella sp. B9012]|uniref:Uncharacterized protein n=1 Tax=Kwoniella europaea PYCC6329 TaxID=1423913 RepID=A0AAX4KX29_9TREE